MDSDYKNRFRAMLERKQAELQNLMRNREAIAIEKHADAMDELQRHSDREMAIRNLNRFSDELRLVRAAIQRIENDEYGICLQCEEDINLKRLTAVPWAPLCIQCQEQADTNSSRHEVAGLEDVLAGAA